VVPSSRFVERRILQLGDVHGARTLVELGSGTGGTTRAILGAMRQDARLLSLEIDPKLHGLLGRIDDRRLIAHRGCAGELPGVLAAHGLPAPEVVISGIPFSTLERSLAARILEAIAALLAPGGRFIAYQVSGSVERLCRPLLGSAHEVLEPLNIPPLRIFRWTKRAR
jgi:phospholipid N-methyltransferase